MKPISIESALRILSEKQIELKSTHDKLCFPIIYRIAKKMEAGIKFPSIKVDGDWIIDGHHRYVASLIVGLKLNTEPSSRTSATVLHFWDTVVLVDEDWDTEAKIRMLNEADAQFNDIPVADIIELIK